MENIPTPSAARRLALSIPDLIARLRATGRTELIHYAGAAHRDPVAWHVCDQYLADPEADEAALKSRALKAAHGWVVAPEQIRETLGKVRVVIAAKPDFAPDALLPASRLSQAERDALADRAFDRAASMVEQGS